jgi:hypothetical protein
MAGCANLYHFTTRLLVVCDNRPDFACIFRFAVCAMAREKIGRFAKGCFLRAEMPLNCDLLLFFVTDRFANAAR